MNIARTMQPQNTITKSIFSVSLKIIRNCACSSLFLKVKVLKSSSEKEILKNSAKNHKLKFLIDF